MTAEHPVEQDSPVSRLTAEFAGSIDAHTVNEVFDNSYASISSKASVETFVPLLAERFARQRLEALTIVGGAAADGKPSVLFLCVHNAGKSQMALGFFTTYAGDRAVAWSGGSEPGASLNQSSVAAMAEVGIDISGEFPKPWTDETLRAADVVVTMGCGDTCPYYPGKRYLDWTFDALPGTSIENVRPVRDEIERKVVALLAELGVEAKR